ncbi:MAG: non-homologous end-joining DNA ligase [Verrucomicrobiota bacterium]
MKTLLVDQLPRGPEWDYEVKFDGFRALAIKQGARISLMSRNALSLADRYPTLIPALRQLAAKEAVLDGEIVAVDEAGRSAFQLLQSYQSPGHRQPPLRYYVFDLLNLEGRSLLHLPLTVRKELLEAVLRRAPASIRFSGAVHAEAAKVLEGMRRQGLEGLIAKRHESIYEPGQRSGAWVKFKWSHDQEFVIGGYTPPKGSRPHFGAILVGYYEKGEFRFASKVGSGFDHRTLASLYRRFQERRIDRCPFVNLPERIPGGISRGEMRLCTWLRPKIVCQVRFTEWTRDGHLRHPLFLGVRDDKKPTEVVRERPSSAVG